MIGQELVDDQADVGGGKRLAFEPHVVARLQRRDDRRVSRRPTDVIFFERLDEARFGVARRRLGEMLVGDQIGELDAIAGRSEEHTSELQSLMRISYAVFCLKKNSFYF